MQERRPSPLGAFFFVPLFLNSVREHLSKSIYARGAFDISDPGSVEDAVLYKAGIYRS